jgi:nitroreductase
MPHSPQGIDLVDCVRTATLAPSIHNSQPWRFGIRPDGVDVYADWRRRLEVIDPEGRQLLISVGAAILNLRLAVHQCGRTSNVRLVRAAGEPQLVAELDVGGPAAVNSTLDELANSIPLRHTNRLPFVPDPVAAVLIEELVAAAVAESATLRAVPEAARDAVWRLVRVAEARLRKAGVYRAELAEWSHPRSAPAVPRPSVGWRAAERLPLRDFGLLTPYRRPSPVPEETYPVVLVLGTRADTTGDRLRAGQALERVWLTATARGLAVAPMSQPLDIPGLRQLMSDPGGGEWPQVILLLGYAPPTTPTPRRDVSETLVDA